MSTLKQVAESSGVSIRTASLVLNGDYRANRITEARAKLVQKAARHLAYRPNSAARAMLTGSFGSVALVLSTDAETSYMPQQLLAGIQTELALGGLNLIVTSVPDDKLTDQGPDPRIVSEKMTDGVILNYQFKIPPGLARLVEHRHLPAVWTNVKRPTDAAHLDDLAMGIKATQHLLQLGHRRIAYADLHIADDKLPHAHYSNLDRQLGYEKAMLQVGLTPVVIRPHTLTQAADQPLALAKATLQSNPRPTAVLGYAGESVGTFAVAAAGLGLSVPLDLSLMTFGLPWTSPFGIDLCIMELPLTRLGREVARLAVKKIADPLAHLPSVAVMGKIMAAASAAAPAGDFGETGSF